MLANRGTRARPLTESEVRLKYDLNPTVHVTLNDDWDTTGDW